MNDIAKIGAVIRDDSARGWHISVWTEDSQEIRRYFLAETGKEEWFHAYVPRGRLSGVLRAGWHGLALPWSGDIYWGRLTAEQAVAIDLLPAQRMGADAAKRNSL